MTGLSLRRGYRVKLSFEILAACEGRGVQAAGIDWPTKQSFYNVTIVDLPCLRVCSLVYRRSDCLVAGAIACSQSRNKMKHEFRLQGETVARLKLFDSCLRLTVWTRTAAATSAR